MVYQVFKEAFDDVQDSGMSVLVSEFKTFNSLLSFVDTENYRFKCGYISNCTLTIMQISTHDTVVQEKTITLGFVEYVEELLEDLEDAISSSKARVSLVRKVKKLLKAFLKFFKKKDKTERTPDTMTTNKFIYDDEPLETTEQVAQTTQQGSHPEDARAAIAAKLQGKTAVDEPKVSYASMFEQQKRDKEAPQQQEMATQATIQAQSKTTAYQPQNQAQEPVTTEVQVQPSEQFVAVTEPSPAQSYDIMDASTYILHKLEQKRAEALNNKIFLSKRIAEQRAIIEAASKAQLIIGELTEELAKEEQAEAELSTFLLNLKTIESKYLN